MSDYVAQLKADIEAALTPDSLLGVYTFDTGDTTPAIKIEGIDRDDDEETAPQVTGLEVVIEPDSNFSTFQIHEAVEVDRECRVTLKAWSGNTIAAREALCRLPRLVRVGDRVPVSKGLGNIESQTLLFSYPQLINRS